jgi:peroxiredoxin
MSPAARLLAMFSQPRRALALGLAVALSLAAVAVSPGLVPVAAAGSGAKISVGSRAPEFDIAKDDKGKAWKVAGKRGKWFVMAMGASWCEFCDDELKVWDVIAKEREFAGRLDFVAVNIDNKPEVGKKFLDKLKLKNLTRVYLPQRASAADDQYATGTFPSTFIIDPSGIVRHVHLGFHPGDADKLRAALRKVLPKKK